MLKAVRFALVFLVAVTAGAALAKTKTIKVLADRTETHLLPHFSAFEKASGIKVEVVFMEDGLLSRLSAKPDEADVVISKSADLLEIARTKKLLKPFQSKKITAAVPKEFRAQDNTYFVDAFRARVIFFAKDRVKPGELSTYADLATAKWKGKLCIRSFYHDYNVSLFSEMIATYGSAQTEAIIRGWHANLAQSPNGNDRDQAKGMFEKKCDVAIMNTYYMPIMLSKPEQKPWAEASAVFFPDQQGKGSFTMRSGLALTKATKNIAAATRLLEYFADAAGQLLTTKLTFQYPTNPSVAMDPSLKLLGAGQKGIVNGSFKKNMVPLAAVAKNRDAVLQILNKAGVEGK